MTEYILSKLQPIPPAEEDSALATALHKGEVTYSIGPRLESLPVEVLHHICVDLPLTSRLSIHLSCRSLASRISLDQLFYRKQLLSGHLFALTDLDLGMVQQRWDEIRDQDWRQLVRDLTRYENFYAGEGGSGAPGKLRDAPIGLKNRMRIIKIVQGIFTGT